MTIDEAIIAHMQKHPGAGEFLRFVLSEAYVGRPLSHDNLERVENLLIELDVASPPEIDADDDLQFFMAN